MSVKQTTSKTWECTEEGAGLASEGSHEARLFASLGKEGRSLADIKANVPNSNIALGAAMKNKVRSNCVERDMCHSFLFLHKLQTSYSKLLVILYSTK